MGCECMAQIMEPNGRHSRFPQKTFQPFVRHLRFHRGFRRIRIREDPLAVGVFLSLLQQVCGTWCQMDQADACFCLRLRHHHPTFVQLHNLSLHLQGSILRIEVLPHETTHFTPAQSGGKFCIEEIVPDGILANHFQKGIQLSFVQHFHRSIVYFGDLGSVGRILQNQFFLYRIIHRLMEQHVGGSYRTVCQFVTMNRMFFHSTRSFELYIHLLDIRSGDFMNRNISQIRFDSILNDGSIVSDCTGAKMHGHDLIQPLIQPFTQGVILSVGKLHFSICFDQAMEFLKHFLLGFIHYGSVDWFAL